MSEMARIARMRADLTWSNRSHQRKIGKHTSELQSLTNLVCRLLLEKKKRQVSKQSVRLQTAVASIMIIQDSSVLDLTEDDLDFLTSNKVEIATDGHSTRRCVHACV